MNRVSFYGGLVLLIIGLIFLIIKPIESSRNNRVKAFGMEFDFSNPAFVIMILGLILMIISPGFPVHFSTDDTFGPDKDKNLKNYIKIEKAIYESKWRPNRVHSYSYASRSCDDKMSCNIVCKNAAADNGDPDVGAPKLCKINYTCSKDPSDKRYSEFGDSDTALYSIKCDN